MRRVLAGVKNFCREADMVLLGLCLAASALGLIVISSATASSENTARYLIVQAGGMALGVLLFIAITLVDLDDAASLWKWILAFNILFTFSTYFFGVERGGNKSWIEVPGIGITVQPAEIVKPLFILLLAKQMYALRERINHPLSVGMTVGHMLLMVGIIWYAADDMGVALIYVFIFLGMFFASGVSLWWILGGVATIAACVPVLWQVLPDYQKMRIMVLLDDTLDPLGIGYQTQRSKIALGSGGAFGQGLFEGRQTQRSILPAKHTDYIYAVVGEELGFIGCVVIILLLVLIIVRCLWVATRAKNGMGSLVCIGVASMLIFQVFENIGMCVGLTPVIGLTLPFFSYGGSSVMTMFMAMGLVSSVKKHPKPGWLKTTDLNRTGG